MTFPKQNEQGQKTEKASNLESKVDYANITVLCFVPTFLLNKKYITYI